MSEVQRSGFYKKTIYLVQLPEDSEDHDFILVVADPRIRQQGLNGWHIQQSKNRTHMPDVVFQVKARMNINRKHIKDTLEVDCKEEAGTFIIPYQQYNRIKEVLKDPSESSEQENQSSAEVSQDEQESSSSSNRFQNLVRTEVKKKGRPFGSKTKKRFIEQSFEDEDDMNQKLKKPRGRPKGSKKKLDGTKQEEYMDEPGKIIDGEAFNSKGRSKGSKNKLKRRDDQQSQRSGQQRNTLNQAFWKRGKGRPKGSKNKSKSFFNGMTIQTPHKQEKKKGKVGRPVGWTKKKPVQDPQASLASQNQHTLHIPEFPALSFEYEQCCNRCYVRYLRNKLLNSKSVQQARELIQDIGTANLFENFQPQRRTNLFITAIQRNNPYFLQLLLQYKDEYVQYFRCCWDTTGIEQDRFTVRTKKQVLSREGKQRILGLLHDYIPRNFNVWWKQVGLQRIMQSFPQHCGKQIIDALIKNDPELHQQLYTNVPITIRSGNYHAAGIILQNPPAKIQSDFYTHQHLEFLKSDLQHQYKKTNILKRSLGTQNYCSPIHCAAINPNGQVLQSIIKNSLNSNVSDNLMRKPIHYAAAAQHPLNLEILCRNGAEIRELDKNKMSPLMIACYFGRHYNVKCILQKCNEPLYVNHKSQEGYSALHYAILREHVNVLEILLQQPSVDFNSETKQKQSCLDLAAANGNHEILTLLLAKDIDINARDHFRRNSMMMSIRNHNNQVFQQLIRQKPKLMRRDSSGNTLLHYAAAYGNLYITKYLTQFMKQTQNKEKLSPWEVAIGKGHLACAKYLRSGSTSEGKQISASQILQKLMLKNVVGSKEGLKAIRFMLSSYPVVYKILDDQENTPLHVLCSCSEQEYIKSRSKQISDHRIIKQEFKNIFQQIIPIILNKGIDRDRQNSKGQTALKISLQKGNLIAMKLLLPNVIDLKFKTSSGLSMINILAMLSSVGAMETKLVLEKLEKETNASVLQALKGTNDDQPLINFVKHFTWRIVANYQQQLDNNTADSMVLVNEIRTKAFKKLVQHEANFIKLMNYFQQIGANFSVKSKVSYQHGWGILHYLMQFPSVKILQYFKKPIKDFNVTTTCGMSPLHLFCQINQKGNLIDKQLVNDYNGEKSLRWLLENGCNVQLIDKDGSSPIHYAALNKQITFMVILMQYKAKINVINKNNNVPLIQLIKMKDYFMIEDFQLLMKLGADPNFSDKNKRSPLHHLVSGSKNFDSSPKLCRLLESYGAQVNSRDQFQRTPLFYCFVQIDPKDKTRMKQKLDPSKESITNDKLQIVQTLMNFKKMDLNHIDNYGRTALHYACQKNYFFSILYLLDRNIDTSIQDNQGNTPLAICLISKNINQAALLLKKGVSMGYVNQNGRKMTYLSYALTNSLVQICHLLLDHGYPPEEALKEEVVKDNQALRKIIIQKCKSRSSSL